MNLNNFVYIDVREEEEFLSGHVEGAINIPIESLASSSLLEGIDKSAQIVVYCRSGGRAQKAKKILEELGYKHVVNGINKASIEAGSSN